MSDLASHLRFLKRKRVANAIASLRRDDGNVESAMVLIPLLIIFLIGIELIIATNLRNTDAALAQGDASRRAISGQVYSTDEVIHLDSPDPFARIKILITHRRTTLPQVVPGLIALMGGSPSTDVKGAAIMESTN